MRERKRKTHLEFVDANIVPLVDVCWDIEVLESRSNEFCICHSVEFEARNKDAVVRVAHILSETVGSVRLDLKRVKEHLT
jgi:hypothetical protein